jgi:hypothetical protein
MKRMPKSLPLMLWCLLYCLPVGRACDLAAAEPEVAVEETSKAANQVAAAPTKIKVPRLAIVTTEFRRNSHSDVIASRIVESYTLDGKGDYPQLAIASVFTDQVPENDVSRAMAAQHGFRISETVEDALTLGTGELAVDGVLLIAEHGDYPKSETGQTIYPKRRLFGEIAAVFEKAGRAVPVYCDKHLADNWEDARWLYDTAERLHVPLMAGSSVPGTWRKPATGVKADRKLKELVMISYGSIDAYGFHALEGAQALVETRAGGTSGVKSVQAYAGDAVWEAGQRGVFDRELLNNALAAQSGRYKFRPLPLEELVRKPILFSIEYVDGLRVNVLSLQGAVADWCASWRYEDNSTDTVLFWLQEERPYYHFALLLQGIEKMMHTGQPTWPAERTLLTSGLLSAGHRSLHAGGKKLETPELEFVYEMPWKWLPPPACPPDQPRLKKGK